MLKLSSAQAEQFKSIGAYLRSQRLEKNLSLEDIAAITMIRLPILQALESGNLEQLPELVYVKGFIRRYGEILKIDGQALANTISNITEPEVVEPPEEPKVAVQPKTAPVQSQAVALKEPVTPVTSSSPALASSGSKSLPYLLFGLGALGLAGVGYYFWNAQSQTTSNAPPVPELQASPAVAPPPSPVPQPSISPSPAPSPVASEVPLSITLKLDDRSWLEIFVDGQLGYRGTLDAGQQKTWTAKKAFNIKAGNAGAVKMSVNNQPAQPLGKLGEVKEVTLTPNENQASGKVNQN